jgi:hypothetical protein
MAVSIKNGVFWDVLHNKTRMLMYYIDRLFFFP